MDMGKRLMLLAAALFVMAVSCNAQWVPTNGPYSGGNVEFLYVCHNSILAGVRAPEVSIPNLVPSEIFRSTDNGRNWMSCYVAGPKNSFTSIIQEGKCLFVGSSDRILKSTDNGRSWFEPDTSLRHIRVASLAVVSKPGTSVLFAEVGGDTIIASTDGGRNWSRLDSSPAGIRTLTACHGYLYASNGTGYYVSTDEGRSWKEGSLKSSWMDHIGVMEDSILFVGTAEGLYFSTDMGNEWKETNAVGKRMEVSGDLTVINYSATPDIIGSDLFAFYHNKLYVSGDKGRTWNSSNIFVPKRMHDLCKAGKYVFVGTEYDGVFRFTYRGTRYGAAGSGLADVGTPCNSGLMKAGVFHLAVSKGVIYAGTKKFGVYRSTDEGKSWMLYWQTGGLTHLLDYVTALQTRGGDICIRTWGGLSFSSDGGARWTGSRILGRQGRGFDSPLAINGPVIFAGTSNGLLRSTDDGKTWAWSDSGMSLSSGRTHAAKIRYLSSRVPPPRPSRGSKLHEVQALVFKGSEIYAGVTGGSIYVSTNDGSYWTHLDSEFTTARINQLTFTGGDLYALTEGEGTFRSADSGKSWVKVNSGFTGLDSHVLVSSGKDLFVGTGTGVYYSGNRGDDWRKVNNGLIDSVIIGLTIHNGYLFAGTWDYGVWKRKISDIVTSASEDKFSKHR